MSRSRALLLRWMILAVGTASVVVALSIDRLGLGRPGFGERQIVLLVIGVGLVLVALASGPGAHATEPHRGIVRLRRAYAGAAVLLLNALLLFVGLNVALLIGFRITDATGLTVKDEAGGLVDFLAVLRLARRFAGTAAAADVWPLDLQDRDLDRIYPGWARSEIRRLLTESRTRPLDYQPFSQFAERPYEGRYVNVSEAGYRRSRDQGPWPMDPRASNLWVLGGSTVFGYGLPDDQTIPSYLQAALERSDERPVRVYNFGQAYYYSAQELTLLYRLLLAADGQPEAVVFIDGVNESASEPFYSEALRELMRSPYTAPYVRPEPPAPLEGEQTVDRYLTNKRLIEAWYRARGIRPLFVWQPSPEWKYDLRFHLFHPRRSESEGQPVLGSSPHYAALERRIAAGELDGDPAFLSLADLQAGAQEPFYVDLFHYTAAFSERIAARIAERLLTGGDGAREQEPGGP